MADRQAQREPPKHISHSSRETLVKCARSYFLSKIAGAPRRPALWLAGGSGVHEVTEIYDKAAVKAELVHMDVDQAWKRHFGKHLAEAREAEPNENVWKRAQSEPIEVWNTIGPQFVQSWIDWRKRSGWEIWTTPDGEPAIELDISGYLPGCPVEIKAYLDRLMYDPLFKKHWIIDLKTGKRPPSTPDQFKTYAALVKVKYGIDCADGAAFMNRKGMLSKPYDLSEATPENVGAVYGEAWEEIQGYLASGEWPADTSDCWMCDVQSSCYAQNGPLAAQFDPSHPDHPDHPDYTGLEPAPF